MSTSEKIPPQPGLQIAIDGPSGVGKSTLGKSLARRLGYLYIDSGAVYRAVGRKALDTGVRLDDANALARLARESNIELRGDPDQLRVPDVAGSRPDRVGPDAGGAVRPVTVEAVQVADDDVGTDRLCAQCRYEG